MEHLVRRQIAHVKRPVGSDGDARIGVQAIVAGRYGARGGSLGRFVVSQNPATVVKADQQILGRQHYAGFEHLERPADWVGARGALFRDGAIGGAAGKAVASHAGVSWLRVDIKLAGGELTESGVRN